MLLRDDAISGCRSPNNSRRMARPVQPVPGTSLVAQFVDVAGNVVKRCGCIRMPLAETIRALMARACFSQFQARFGSPSALSEYARSLCKWAKSDRSSQLCCLYSSSASFNQLFYFLGLASVKRWIGLEPCEAAGLLRREFQGVTVPFS